MEEARELLIEPRCGRGGWLVVGIPFRIDGLEGVRDEGKDESDSCRLRLLLMVPVVPLVEGRYERTEVIFILNALQRRVSKIKAADKSVQTYVD